MSACLEPDHLHAASPNADSTDISNDGPKPYAQSSIFPAAAELIVEIYLYLVYGETPFPPLALGRLSRRYRTIAYAHSSGGRLGDYERTRSEARSLEGRWSACKYWAMCVDFNSTRATCDSVCMSLQAFMLVGFGPLGGRLDSILDRLEGRSGNQTFRPFFNVRSGRIDIAAGEGKQGE